MDDGLGCRWLDQDEWFSYMRSSKTSWRVCPAFAYFTHVFSTDILLHRSAEKEPAGVTKSRPLPPALWTPNRPEEGSADSQIKLFVLVLTSASWQNEAWVVTPFLRGPSRGSQTPRWVTERASKHWSVDLRR